MSWKGAWLPASAVLALAAVGGNSRWQRTIAPGGGPADCARCHAEVHAEWQDSAHARAFTDPVFQQQLATRSEPERCLPCHTPASVLDRLGRMPSARAEDREHGITCSACHQRGAEMHGPTSAVTEAHPTVQDGAFTRRGSFGLCRGCHDLRIADVLPLARDFVHGGLLDDDQSCVGCHMERIRRPAADGSRTTNGRSHRLLGPGDAEFCASAFLLRVERRGARAVLIVTNGAGHGVPGLARLRSFAVLASLRSAAGKELVGAELVLSSEDRLLVDEERVLPLPDAAGATMVAVRVEHRVLGRKPVTVSDQLLELP